ncbi:hypothetical protein [Algoriphagus machipongonensis]|uniref:Membrane protein n=1 Tax=Algoriphagus machipongonensis TaxID=388413 RepID=A3HRP1_9BACT|nr:hypothetical protein [Algoriphagus machipongonensis]EAZ82509.1 membrane protein [Algoriphagus machipongonensis]
MKSTSSLKQFGLFTLGIYILIYGFPFPLDHIPFTYEYFSKYVIALQEKFIIFFGQDLLGIEKLEKIQRTGSGDTTFDYVRIPASITLSILLALVLILIKKTRGQAENFYKWTLIYARYFVGLTLISYGIAKFLEGQFPGPTFYSMEVLFGNISPMGLAWRFFGYSDTYKIFMGLSEIVAGFLLLFRRTSILGALVSISVCLNIVLVNFSFDVPVKLFSSHLLVFSFLVLIPKIKPVVDFFILHKSTTLGEMKPLFEKRKYKIIWLIANLYLIGLIPITRAVSHVQSQKFRTMENEWEGLYSGFDSDSTRFWDKMVLEKNYMVLQTNDGKRDFLSIEEIEAEGHILIKNPDDSEKPHELFIKELDNKQYEILLRIGEKENLAIGDRKDKSDYELIKRGFNWINEYPYNR